MKKNSTLAYIVTIMMVFTLLAPVVIAPPVQAAGIPEIVDQMNEIIPYLDQADKDAIQAARVSLQGIPLNDARWNTVLGVGTANNLLTSQVIAQFEGVDEAEKTAAAKEALINVAIGLGNIYYSQNATVLETDLTDFKETNKATFQKLFGTTTSVDDLYQLLQATRGQFGSVISANGTYLNNLAFGSNATLVDTIPEVLDDAMQNVLNTNPAFTEFRGKLEAIGWSTTKLINQQKELGTIIDNSQAARLGLAKAMVRSETTLASGVPTTFAIDEVIPHSILIMGRDATDIVEWQSSSSVVEVTTDTQTDNYILTAKAPGTATLTAFRDVDPDNPAEASDWIFKYDVTVDGSAVVTPPSSGGGGSSTPASTVTTVTATQGGTITGSGATIVIPANATSSDIKVKVETVTSTANLPLAATEKLVSKVLEITKDKSGDFAKPVTITINFDKSKVDADKYDIAIYWLDTKTNKWVKLDNVSVDMTNGKVSGETTHFTKFAVIATAKEEAKPPVTPVKVQLTDIAGHWAQADIQKLVAAGVISGYPNKTFKPDANISRAEFAVAMVKALKLAPKSGKVFNDTANHWAKDSIATAQAYGIINGYSDTKFGPNDKITREQMAVMVARGANLTATADAKTFTDSAKVSAWAKDGVMAASSNGIITGYPDGSFKPQANATRAHAVTIIAKILK